MKTLLTLLQVVIVTLTASAQSDIFGLWKTIDDDTGKEKSIVEIYEQDGKAFGRITTLLDPDSDNPDPLCTKCKDERKDKPIRGLQIIQNMLRDGDTWSKGKILDPENGKVYNCKLWVEDGELRVRGYISILYRTQTWFKAE